jgi:hypothetical protein
MASITNSVFPISPVPSKTQQSYSTSGRKRRSPIDPPGEDACNETYYASPTSPLMSLKEAALGQPPNKRTRTVDNSLEMLSLRAADPPGHYSFQIDAIPIADRSIADVHMNQTVESQPIKPVGANVTNDTTSSTSTMTTSNIRPSANVTLQSRYLSTNDRMQQCRRMDQSSSGITDAGNSEMSLEGSDMYNDDESLDSSSGSVSESSIRNSMYQVVFGRMKGIGSGGNGANYDFVDAKIEDLIRRSRMEAVLKSTKDKQTSSLEEDTDNSTKSMDLG